MTLKYVEDCLSNQTGSSLIWLLRQNLYNLTWNIMYKVVLVCHYKNIHVSYAIQIKRFFRFFRRQTSQMFSYLIDACDFCYNVRLLPLESFWYYTLVLIHVHYQFNFHITVPHSC